MSSGIPGHPAEIIASSHKAGPHDLAVSNGKLYASSDSLVRGAIDAWAQHQHLVLRPDVVWFEILAQFDLYMAKHAEELRHLFVNFMMGLMQQYFKFTGAIICGLPSVRLLGWRDDWAALLGKLERLGEFGAEPAQYARNLRPILSMFVKTWDEPETAAVRDFWKQIVRADKAFSCGAGPAEYDVLGWITGFMHWTANGDLRVPADAPADAGATRVGDVVYHSVNLAKLPVGYAKAPFKMLNYPAQGSVSTGYVVAGNIGLARAEAAAAAGRPGAGVLTQLLSAWFLYGPVNASATAASGAVGSFDELTAIYSGLRSSCPASGKGYAG